MKLDDEKFIVVFDLDETLGHFSQLNIFWSILERFYSSHNMETIDKDFFKLIDIFDKFLRPNIMQILDFLKQKKEAKKCEKVMIYTNNNGPKSWANLIRDYFHNKLDYHLFDQVIGAFKVQDRQIEMCRTSHYKSVSDLIKCTMLPENTKICFIDDVHHPEMEHENVVYLHIKPYVYNYKFKDMIETYYTKNREKIDKITTHEKFMGFFKRHSKGYKYDNLKKTSLEQEIDDILGKKIIDHLEEFFKTKRSSSHTRKRRAIRLNTTRRIRRS